MSIEELYSLYKKYPVVCSDSRAIAKGSIFFALKGGHFNGNVFAATALEQGAAYAVVDEEKFAINERCILVDDTLDTLQKLARFHRDQFNIPFIAITGSNGKTTTKELTRNVLSKKFRIHATKGNLNNHIGVPLTILSIPLNAEAAVIEIGANHIGEIKLLCEIAAPDYGIVTNVGKAHLEGFGGFEGVKKGKGELYDFLAQAKGTIFLDADNEMLVAMASERTITKRITYGSAPGTNCHGELISSSPFLKVKWGYGAIKSETASQLTGSYNFENILAAVCIGNYFGVDAAHINQAIEEYVPDNSRSQVIQKETNTIILDAYNANPTSVAAALKNFNSISSGHKIIFLGEMAELGDESETEHQSVIEILKHIPYEELILAGKNFSRFADQIPCHYFETSAEATDWTKTKHFQNCTILIKGSRSMKMEKVMEGL
ncbi:MAG: UDP-N-acetylmuramoyl-tripeptide--D-alanyl-D-alanine ligase [Bacteroidetes bacterium]|nr:UDP-N-acetylmuramoyl-tripeptide--D-alanyl-D-alanine ligase [Bacteroidota bacterium]